MPDEATAMSAERAAPPIRDLVRSNLVTCALLVVPLAFFLYQAWTHRFMSDDGFINVRVVQQILAGNGPVFNAGERVEVATSPLWIVLLLAGKVPMFWLPTEWVAVVLGIVTTIAGLAAACLASARAYRTWRLVPLGLIVYVVIPPAASYASSGLENGLTSLWIASWYLALLRAADSRRGRDAVPAAVLIGLGPLVRPDLTVMSIVAGAALLYLSRPRSARRALRLIGAAVVIPGAYELFRMGYYGNLLPNTAYVKEATAADWHQGWTYLVDLVHPYLLWIAGLLVLAAAALTWRRAPADDGHAGPTPLPSGRLVALGTPAVAGLLYGALVTRGGGDFMHGRLLLPAVFAIMLPVAAIPRRAASNALAVAALAWAVVPLAAGGPPYHGIGPNQIDDEPGLLSTEAHRSNPVTLHDNARNPLEYFGAAQRRLAAHGDRSLSIFMLNGAGVRLPLDPDGPALVRTGDVYGIGAIGMFSVAAGVHVYVADSLSLASPIGSRFVIHTRRRAGHDKYVPPAWFIAMFADPSAPTPSGVSATDVAAARRALRCPAIAAELARARAPLSVSRVWTNFTQALTDYSTRTDPDPVVAARCGR